MFQKSNYRLKKKSAPQEHALVLNENDDNTGKAIHNTK